MFSTWSSRVKTNRRKRLRFEILEQRRVFAGQPMGAFEEDTGEFMLGRVAVTPVFLESNGQEDVDTENWTQAQIQNALNKIREGLQWWEDALAKINSVHHLDFVVDTTFADTPVQTKYEPISRPSNGYTHWVSDFLTGVGQSSTIQTGIRAFNHSQRVKLNTDWAFTIFVVPSENDADGQFASGGTFSDSFSFAGGLFAVVPSSQPASTIAHETGHLFWALDEYATPGTSFTLRRGYYNTPNLNAPDNTAANFTQQPSIMASGTLRSTAYANHISPVTTLAMVGWQDSDRDGIFDVLDVPLKLTGSGYLDSATGRYLFQGQASAQTLPNLNTEGFKNDITINRIRRIEYRIDGGPWQVASQPNEYVSNLNLSIAVTSGATTIEIRALDERNNVLSNVFTGHISRADATVVPGINGSAWIDANKNGVRDPGEFGESGWPVNLVGANGDILNLRTTIEPDNYPAGPLASNFSNALTLTSIGSDADGRVGVSVDSKSSTGTKLFQGFSKSGQSNVPTWSDSNRSLLINFTSPTSVVEIDAIGSDVASFGRLEVYSASGVLLGRYTTGELASGVIERMSVSRGTADMAYAIASGHALGSIRLDNLRFGPETTVTTSARGTYAFTSLPAGTYQVQIVRPDLAPINPSSGRQTAAVFANTSTTDINFGFVAGGSFWQNPRDRFNVNNDDVVSALDALIVIDDLSRRGSRDLTGSSTSAPPYVDVSGDKQVSPLDVLLIIDFLVKRNSGGSSEGESESQGTVTQTRRIGEPVTSNDISLLAASVVDFGLSEVSRDFTRKLKKPHGCYQTRCNTRYWARG